MIELIEKHYHLISLWLLGLIAYSVSVRTLLARVEYIKANPEQTESALILNAVGVFFNWAAAVVCFFAVFAFPIAYTCYVYFFE